MAITKIKIPKYMKRMIEEVSVLTARTESIHIALRDDKFMEKLDENQLTSLSDQAEVMDKYEKILQERITYDAMKFAKKETGKKDILGIRITRKKIHIYTDIGDAVEMMFGSLEKVLKGKPNDKEDA